MVKDLVFLFKILISTRKKFFEIYKATWVRALECSLSTPLASKAGHSDYYGTEQGQMCLQSSSVLPYQHQSTNNHSSTLCNFRKQSFYIENTSLPLSRVCA